jgi:sulfite exporter TauE/SafE
MKERRSPFVAEEQKFSTQRVVTYVLLIIFAAVTAYVFYGDDQAERSTVLQTVINFTMLAIGFWLGSSKGSADKEAQLNQIRKAETPQATDTDTVGAAKETVVAAKATVAVAEEQGK